MFSGGETKYYVWKGKFRVFNKPNFGKVKGDVHYPKSQTGTNQMKGKLDCMCNKCTLPKDKNPVCNNLESKY